MPLITILLVLFVDQAIKIWVKTSFPLHHHIPTEPFGETNKAELLFIENAGMAFGVELGGNYGKLLLSLFRIFAAIFGVFYIRHIIRKREHPGYIFCVALIFAGAVGNIIDSAFYGMIFSESTVNQVAVMFPPGGGYSGFLHGKVVDMFHLPFWHGTFPNWFPIWGGQDFEFFSPIFNFADASISVGVILIFIFQRKFFKKAEASENKDAILESSTVTPAAIQTQTINPLNESNVNQQGSKNEDTFPPAP